MVAQRHAVPRAGDAGRLRRALPAYDRGCYGCFGPDGDAEHRVARAGVAASSARQEPDLVRVFRSFNAYADAVPEGERSA